MACANRTTDQDIQQDYENKPLDFSTRSEGEMLENDENRRPETDQVTLGMQQAFFLNAFRQNLVTSAQNVKPDDEPVAGPSNAVPVAGPSSPVPGPSGFDPSRASFKQITGTTAISDNGCDNGYISDASGKYSPKSSTENQTTDQSMASPSSNNRPGQAENEEIPAPYNQEVQDQGPRNVFPGVPPFPIPFNLPAPLLNLVNNIPPHLQMQYLAHANPGVFHALMKNLGFPKPEDAPLRPRSPANPEVPAFPGQYRQEPSDLDGSSNKRQPVRPPPQQPARPEPRPQQGAGGLTGLDQYPMNDPDIFLEIARMETESQAEFFVFKDEMMARLEEDKQKNSRKNNTTSPPLVITAEMIAQGRDKGYWDRRQKNNQAAKRSRDTRKLREQDISIRKDFLERQNVKTIRELAALKVKLRRMKGERRNRE